MLQVIHKIEAVRRRNNILVRKQKAETRAKMLQIQGENARARVRARLYKDYNQMEVNGEVDEVESNVYEEKVQQR